MKSLVSYFIKYPVAANILMLLILIFGYMGLKNIQSSFFPEMESRTIKINTTYPGASPEEIEKGVVLKIEDNLKGITGIDRLSSTSKENTATITVEVEKGYNTDFILQDVKNAVDRISSFPEGMEPPEIFKKENLDRAITFSVSGDVSLKTLKEYARDIEDDLRAVEGLSKISLSGFPAEEIEIALRERDMRAFQLTFEEVAKAVRAANLEITGGKIKGRKQEMLIRARSKKYHGKELQNIVVKGTEDGSLVRLKDIAEVKDRWDDNPNRTYLNNNPAVEIIVSSTVEEDILFIANYVKDYVKDFNAKNEVVHATIIDDRTDSLRGRIDLLLNNGALGFVIVLILLALFLNLRLAFWVAIAIPISFMGMFIIASFYGITINVISLFGMILVIGILVDDGIIFSENIYQHYERGKKPLKAALDGTLEVLPPVTAAILTTVVAFSTFFFLSGRIGEFITEMAFVVIFTLIFSLLEGFTILPAHVGHSKALRQKNGKNKLNQKTDAALNWLKNKIYAPVLRFSIENKIFALLVSTTIFIGTISLLMGGIVKFTFFPSIERNNITVNLEMPAGTQDEITQDRLEIIEEAAWQVNKELTQKRNDSLEIIQHIQKSIGPGINKGNLNIILLESKLRNRNSKKITNLIRKKAGEIPGAEKVNYGVGSPFGKPVSVSLKSNELPELKSATEKLKDELKQLSSVKDVVDNNQPGLREYNIHLKEKAHLLDLNLRMVMAQVRNGFFGHEIQRLQRGEDEVKVWVRYRLDNRRSLSQLENMRIRTSKGKEYPLEEIANISMGRGVLQINHLDNQREIRVEADMASAKSSSTEILNEIETNILPDILKDHPGINYSFEGQSRESKKTQESAQKIMPVIFILMIGIVVLTFRSFIQTFVVFAILPFGFIGVVWGHYIQGIPISILSNYGIIALIGIMINDSLVLVTAMNNTLKQGKDYMTAVYYAGLSRFRPILLTSLTTIAGLGPIILEKSFQAQFLKPMAVSVAYGMGIATLVTLLVLPILLVIFNSIRVYAKYLWTGQKPSKEEVEPAVREMKSDHQIEE